MSEPILIVGGGLAGLTVARRLHQAGVEFLMIEARDRLGGRILTVDAAGDPGIDGFDLGPSWIWPEAQPALGAFIAELGLATFKQNAKGDVVFHRMSRETPQRYRAPAEPSASSLRIAGGSGALVAALAADLPAACIRLGVRVTRVVQVPHGVEANLVAEGGAEETLKASHVVFALPPRLLEATVSFSPNIEIATAQAWRAAPTWMAPHAKVFALYDRPFWREAGLSGTAQSMVGPLVEIHDATTASGQAALFGFLGMSADQRAVLSRDAIAAACIAQLVRLFGPEAETPRATLFKDWASDPLTATGEDRSGGGHLAVHTGSWVDAAWGDRISLAGSETADSEPGYLAGAVAAAERAASDLISQASASR